ncbi:MAG: nucleoside triphosphate pyrophosphohydrolase [Gemmatimonadaceae bacterium]|nr:nucleoside triphosphate pyrophosphohydrolase [Gloeobacterales cyanobacterium ES-bin-141]
MVHLPTSSSEDQEQVLQAINALVDVVRRLRDPVRGCPWDLEQTPLTLCQYIIEEAYETVDAIETAGASAVEEELGDLLLQVVLQAQIYSETGTFGLAEVAEGITRKLIRRHPHIFGDVQVNGSEDVRRNWEEIKAREKAGQAERPLSAKLSSLVRRLPALNGSAEISRRVAKVGFEWPDAPSVWEKLREELGELEQAIAGETRERQAEELGDVLFTLLNVARWQGIDAEAALRETNRRFLNRFAILEDLAGASLGDCPPAQLEALWQQAKQKTTTIPDQDRSRE